MDIRPRLVVSVVTLALILATAPLYSDALFEESLIYIPSIQRNSTPAQQLLWRAWSNGGLAAVITLPVLATFAVPTQRVRCFYYVCVLSLVFAIMNFTKLGFHQARPYWVSADVAAYACSTDFGNPSGHCETVAGMSGALALDFSSTRRTTPMAKALALAAAGAFSLSIAYSRLFLGVHSLNQVLFGLLLGVWLASTMEFCARRALFRHAGALVAAAPPRAPAARAAWSAAALAFALALATAQYAALDGRGVVEDEEEEWRDRIAEECGADALNRAFAPASFAAVGADALAFGAHAGLLLQSCRYAGMARYAQPPGAGRVLLRLLLQAAFGCPVLLLGLLASTRIANVYVLVFLTSVLPLTLTMVILFGFSDELALCAGLYTEVPCEQLGAQLEGEHTDFSLNQIGAGHGSIDASNPTTALQEQSDAQRQRQVEGEQPFSVML